ncbi:MAG: response regulator, partial [Alphaproteobacteria bacterium]|nr:response regulator [Alphaproteobacteria bacterium]
MPGQFTEFTLRFPHIAQAEIDAHTREVIQNARQVFQGRRVLVVDDQAIMRRSTRLMLDGLGLAFDEAENGEQAIGMIGQSHYDLIIMDLNMPVLDG